MTFDLFLDTLFADLFSHCRKAGILQLVKQCLNSSNTRRWIDIVIRKHIQVAFVHGILLQVALCFVFINHPVSNNFIG